MDRIDRIRAFVTVVDAGSFTQAAARLRLSNKLVSKYVAALEADLGVTLLHRTTRALSLTSAGERYLEGRAVCCAAMTNSRPDFTPKTIC
ncbi:LysR family transcriptional regulator [Paracoccus cavernae]|uniref:LysR family transcriptional regulator n=1 Tax=Paracoccus cavernae TaxID=1571207 RepID=UPI0036417576